MSYLMITYSTREVEKWMTVPYTNLFVVENKYVRPLKHYVSFNPHNAELFLFDMETKGSLI